MANILGLHFGHDSSVSLIKNGRLVSAISLERLNKIKKYAGMTEEAIDYVLSEGNLSIKDIDAIGVADYTKNDIIKLYVNDVEVDATSQKLFSNNIVKGLFSYKGLKIPAFIIPHHLCHCSAAFYTSNFEKSYCLSVDSSGGYKESNSLVAYGEGNRIVSLYCPNLMVGNAYAIFTQKLGIGDPVYKAGSTMGLGCYGKIIKDVSNNLEKYIKLNFFSKEFEYLQAYENLWLELSGRAKNFDLKDSDSIRAMNIAATIQYIFENSILSTVLGIDNNQDINNLCLSGGSMLNCNTNSLILSKTRYKNIHLFPACGDDGVSVGAGLYIAHNIYNEPRQNYKSKDICYLGKKYSENKNEIDYSFIAKAISNGKIIGWYQGRSEYGPRALGNRSILADPRNFHNRELINFVIKRREWYRPFAPSIIEEKCRDWFDFDYQSPYMLFTANVKKPQDIPAVTHVDNSARMQTVSKELNENYYNLIDAFYKETGVPMVLNTSLNCNGEPILETEEDANRFFDKVPVDIMVINGKIIKRD